MNHFDDNLDLLQQLSQIIQKTCNYPRDGLERKQGLTKIIFLMQRSRKIWRGDGSISLHDYEDALQKTWIFFCRNLCEAVTAEPYNPEIASVITWFNNHLKFRIRDIHQTVIRENDNRIFPTVDRETGELINSLENIPAPPENSTTTIEEIQEWLKNDRKNLSRIHVRDRTDINPYLLISRRLILEQTWRTISEEFNVPIPTLAKFYNHRCLPLILEWGKSQGYLDDRLK